MGKRPCDRSSNLLGAIMPAGKGKMSAEQLREHRKKFPRSVRKYKYFPRSGDREKLQRQISNIARELYHNKINHVVALDVRGRAAGLLLHHAWHTMYPGVKPPKVYFIKPHGFYEHRNKRGAELKKAIKQDAAKIDKQMKRDSKYLYNLIKSKPKEPIMVLDDVIYSGGTMFLSKAILESVGAKNLITKALGNITEVTPIEHIKGYPLGVSLEEKDSLKISNIKDKHSKEKHRLRLELKKIARGLKKEI